MYCVYLCLCVRVRMCVRVCTPVKVQGTKVSRYNRMLCIFLLDSCAEKNYSKCFVRLRPTPSSAYLPTPDTQNTTHPALQA